MLWMEKSREEGVYCRTVPLLHIYQEQEESVKSDFIYFHSYDQQTSEEHVSWTGDINITLDWVWW